MKRLLAWILALAMLVPMGLTGYAYEEPQQFYVRARLTSTGMEETLTLLNIGGKTYIAPKDLARAADVEVLDRGQSHGGVFRFRSKRSGYVFELRGGKQGYERAYLPLKESAEALRLSYFYNPQTQTLKMQAAKRFPEDLVAMCVDIFGGGKLNRSPYYLGYMRDEDPFGVATVFGVLTQYGYMPSDLAAGVVSWALGNYDFKLYIQTLEEILTEKNGQPREIEASVRELEDRTVDVANGFSTLLDTELVKDVTIQQILESTQNELWMGSSLEDLRNILDMADTYDSNPLLKVSNLLAMNRFLHLKKDSCECYLKAYQYGTKSVDSMDRDCDLRRAAKKICNQLGDKAKTAHHLFAELTQNLIAKAGEISFESQDWWKSAQKGTPYAQYGDIFLSLLSSATGVEENVSAVQMGKTFSDVQRMACESVPAFDPESRDFDILALKYCTILYLRACQCGYLHFTDKEDIGKMAQTAADNAKKKIMELNTFSTDELTLRVHNLELDLEHYQFPGREADLPVMPYRCQEAARRVSQAVVQAVVAKDDPREYCSRHDSDDILDKMYFGQNVLCFQNGGAIVPEPVFVEILKDAGYGMQPVQNRETREFYLLECVEVPARSFNGTNDGDTNVLSLLNQPSRNHDGIEMYQFGRFNGRELEYITRELPGNEVLKLFGSAPIYGLNRTKVPFRGFSAKDAKQWKDHLNLGILHYTERNIFEEERLYDDAHHLFPPEQLNNLVQQLERSTENREGKFKVQLQDADLNQDGYPDAAVLFYAPTAYPVEQTLTKRKVNLEKVDLEPNCGLLFLGDREGVTFKVMTTEELEEQIKAYNRAEKEADQMPDGQHYVVLYRDQIRPAGYGWLADVDHLIHVSSDDPYLDVQRWEISHSGKLRIAENTEVVTCRNTSQPQLLDSVQALFAGDDRRGIRVLVEVRNGYAVSITEEYTPFVEAYD